LPGEPDLLRLAVGCGSNDSPAPAVPVPPANVGAVAIESSADERTGRHASRDIDRPQCELQQYRGTTGAPLNAIQWRVLYGSADDLSVRYEPDTAKRFASVFLLNPATTYHWKATWGSDFHLVVREGGHER
jgi:hypothetical protein